MSKYKKQLQYIICAILLMFSVSKCTQSCNRATKIDELQASIEQTIQANDSTINMLTDSIRVLNTTIQVYQERVSGMQQSIDLQEEAARRLAESKKNINVNVQNRE